ncbi:MAG: SDR family oxidoreductase [Actinomycetota bacterium]|nr:SDR family oxidoreductase [Actinomycetota bacterium]
MTVLVTGATGLLGPWLLDEARRLGSTTGVARHGADAVCDLTDRDATRSLLVAVCPRVVIHAAALTDVDLCERRPELATLVNTMATAHVAEAAGEIGARVVFLSTDQVYPDTKGPHSEGDVAPVNAYGRSKLAAEAEVLARGGLVLRANFFGPSRTPGRESLSDFFVRSLPSGAPVSLYTDIMFSPVHVATLARTVADAIEQDLLGCFNVGSREGFSKHDFALALAQHLDLPTSSVVPALSDDAPGRAPRPHDLRMDVSRLEAALGRVMPTLWDEVRKL